MQEVIPWRRIESAVADLRVGRGVDHQDAVLLLGDRLDERPREPDVGGVDPLGEPHRLRAQLPRSRRAASGGPRSGSR